jgi:hypothetical protein
VKARLDGVTGRGLVARFALAVGIAALTIAGCLGSPPGAFVEGPDATNGTSHDAGEDATLDGSAPPLGSDGESAMDGGSEAGDAGPGEEAGGCLDGACAPGECQNANNGTPCDGGFDGSAVCNGGACQPCNVGADCTEAGSCQQMNVVCASGSAVCTANGTVSDGKPCGVNLFCNTGSCQACTPDAGCQPQAPDNPCDQGSVACVQGQVQCNDTHVAAKNGTNCGTNKVCLNGACVGCTSGVGCSPADCRTGQTSCATGTSQCLDMDASVDNVNCTATNGCLQTFTCKSGSCVGSSPVSCPASDQCHTAGTCTSTSPTTHTCSNPSASNTTTCNDNNGCTQTDTCNGSGQCAGSNPVACAAIDNCHGPGTCASTGATTYGCDAGSPLYQTSCGSNMECAAGTCYPLCGAGLPAPAGYYPLDRDFADYSGNARNGSSSTAYLTSGALGNGAGFNGQNSEIVLGFGPTSPTTGARTFCTWIAPIPNGSPTVGQPVMTVINQGQYVHLGIAASPPTGSCGAANTLFMYDNVTNSCQASGLTVAANNWNFICYAFDGSMTATFFVNGTTATVTPATQTQAWYGNFDIGVSIATNDPNEGQAFSGLMDEIVVYGQQLSVAQMTALYNGGNGCKVK